MSRKPVQLVSLQVFSGRVASTRYLKSQNSADDAERCF